ncbi:MAG: nuclear transport factor 2 family protein [Chloroflexota bacterium]
MTRDDLQDWLDRYIAAWRSYDRVAIADLFSEDAEYRYHPGDEPTRGRETIVDEWVAPAGNASERDAPDTWAAQYEAFAVDGNRAVSRGRTTYWTDASHETVEHEYFNIFMMEFDGAGRCRSFTEYFMQPRKKARPLE